MRSFGKQADNTEKAGQLSGYLSTTGIWALSFGAAVGWGAFAMPGNVFLPAAGPLGTALGLIIGALVMFIIGVNYHYLMSDRPDAGGAYGYAKKAFDYDHGFLAAWFLLLTYIAILWANATALSLFVRAIFGDVFQFGFHYTIAGFDIYFGETMLSALAILLFGFICAFCRKTAKWIQIVFAFTLIIGVVVSFVAALVRNGFTLPGFEPAFAAEGSPAGQVIAIIALAPWAYVGFESVSHSSEEFTPKVKRNKLLRTLVAALITAAAAYVLLELLAVTAVPEGFADREAYLAGKDALSGTAAIPTLNAARTALGGTGTIIIAVTLLAGIITGIIANYIAASRLTYALARDGLFPKALSKINSAGVPGNAVVAIMIFSFFIPFLGRTATGWIVDVTTIGAAVAYAFVSLSAFKLAGGERKSRLIRATGLVGLVISLFFLVYFLVPEIGRKYVLSNESYLILITWSVVGIIIIRLIIGKDKTQRTGRSAVVWVSLLVVIILISMLWVRQSINNTTSEAISEAADKYEQMIDAIGADGDDPRITEAEEYLEDQFNSVRARVVRDNFIQMGIIIVSLGCILGIFTIVQKRQRETEAEKIRAEQTSKAKSTFLSNMSHDIRTPMNAVIGYTTIAMREPDLPPRVTEYLEKIDFSSRHLLSLINDVLDMSRIENGKMELQPEPADIVSTMDKIRDIFQTQMEEKGIVYTVDAGAVAHNCVSFDENRFMRVLLNLISNSFKFTEPGGSVAVTLAETGFDGTDVSYEMHVKDTGIGMSPEFAEHVFEAFERERSKTVSGIQGTGLGMAITKNFIDLMGGTIEVATELGKGTEFTVRFALPACDEKELAAKAESEKQAEEKMDFTGKKLLIADDNPVNREIACMLLENVGFTFETAENGKEALDKIAASRPGDFDAVLMDVRMPVMNGYEATIAIRSLDSPVSRIPIIAMSANAFAEDVQEAKDAGMNAHSAKPIEIEHLLATLRDLIGQ